MFGVGDGCDKPEVCEARVIVFVDKDVHLQKESSQREEV